MYDFKNSYDQLKPEEKYIYDLIILYHDYFSKQDKKYRKIVRLFKVITLMLAMLGTIVLGLKGILNENLQITIGLVFSSLLTFFTALSAYFNFEQYWMRNVTIHIKLNILRDNFVYDAKSKKINENTVNDYRKELEKLQKDNINYWKKIINRD